MGNRPHALEAYSRQNGLANCGPFCFFPQVAVGYSWEPLSLGFGTASQVAVVSSFLRMSVCASHHFVPLHGTRMFTLNFTPPRSGRWQGAHGSSSRQ